jgi:hypothetical protein
MVSAIALSGYSQVVPSLGSFETTFDSFMQGVASTITLNSLAGSNWSDAYVGGFPHLGLGLTVATTFAKTDATSQIFSLFGAGLPSSVTSVVNSLGLPVPAAAGSFKIGLPFIPLDIGIKGGYIPASVGNALKSSTGVGMSYENIGLTVRYALVKQNLILPNVSIGASYDYLKGSLTVPTGIPTPSINVPDPTGANPSGYNISMTDPDLDLYWTSNTFDFNVQVSKTLLFFLTPYLGAGYTLGTSSFSGGLSSNITTNYPGTLDQLESLLSQHGVSVPFNNAGINYSSTVTTPVLRLYGGLALNIVLVRLDFQAIFVPAMGNQSQAFGAAATARLQF